MFKIIKDGVEIAMTEKPAYIKRADNGYFNLCEKSEATGVAVGSEPFGWLGHTAGEDYKNGIVLIVETDAGGEISKTNATVDENNMIALEAVGELGDMVAKMMAAQTAAAKA